MRLSALKEVDYILESERAMPPSEQTVFVLKQPTGADKMRLASLAVSGATDIEVALRLVQVCVTGWRNMLDESGKEVAFTPDRIDFLDEKAFTELGNEIYSMGFISDEDKKK